MGFSVSWVAFENTKSQDALRLLKLADTGIAVDTNDTLLSGTQLPNGWYVLFINRVAHRLCESKTLRPLSEGRRIVVCQVEEHVMASSSFACENGKKIWDITHESERGIYDLRVEGSPPEILDGVRQEKLAAQAEEGGEEADVDYVIEVPVEIAKQLVGFAHDRLNYEWGTPVFTRLEPLAS